MSETPPLRYVVLRHEGIPDPHFDLMLELQPGGSLTTWRTPAWPIKTRVRLTPLPAHRPAYLQYEGPLSGDRGTVRRVASGTFTFTRPTERTWYVRLTGIAPFDALELRTWQDTHGVVRWDAFPIVEF